MKDTVKSIWIGNGIQSRVSLSNIKNTILERSFIALPNFVTGISIRIDTWSPYH